jgi:hypothetical protein
MWRPLYLSVFLLPMCSVLTDPGRGGEMADTLASGASERKLVRVRVPPSVPLSHYQIMRYLL